MQRYRDMRKRETFVVHIIDQENATWQGQVTWLERKETMSFRSLLELIRLMDGAVDKEEQGVACLHNGK